MKSILENHLLSNFFRPTKTSNISWTDVFVAMNHYLIDETITLTFVKISISIVIAFAFSLVWKSASFAKNLIVDSLIILKASANSRKNISQIVFLISRHAQSLIVAWNNISLTLKTLMMTTISMNILKNYRSMSRSKTFRSVALFWSSLMNILKRSMNRKQNVFWSRSNH